MQATTLLACSRSMLQSKHQATNSSCYAKSNRVGSARREAARDGARSRAAAAIQRNRTTTFWDRAVVLCKRFSVQLDSTARSLRHTGAQTLADAGHDRASIQAFLGHKSAEAASHYIRASFKASRAHQHGARCVETLQQPLGHIDRQFRLSRRDTAGS